jgi:hypothetical protein
LKGVVLGNPQAMITEWMPFGPLDIYLQENLLHVKTPELIEAASHIAKAVWFLVSTFLEWHPTVQLPVPRPYPDLSITNS